MKTTVNISKLVGIRGAINNVPLRKLWFFWLWSFGILGLLTIVFYGISPPFGVIDLRFFAYLAGLLATVALLGWISFCAAIFARIAKGLPDDKVLVSLLSTLRGPGRNSNPLVRF